MKKIFNLKLYIITIFIFIIITSTSFPDALAIKNNKQLLSIDLVDYPTKQAITWLAKMRNINILLSSKISGELNIHWEKLTWKQAFKTILKSQGLNQWRFGNVIYVAPCKELFNKKQNDQKISQQATNLTILIKLKYSNAKKISQLFKQKNGIGLLSKHGYIGTDERTNSLLICDDNDHLIRIKDLLKKLDSPVPQILILAHIVNIDSDYERELGIKFDWQHTQLNSGLYVDLPTGNRLPLGASMLKIPLSTLLNLELSALETEGHAELISDPKLLTSNQESATIEAGEEIPYQQAAAQGGTATTFKKAALSLQVKPQIIPGNKIILHLKISQDKRSTTESQGIPSIETRHIDTNILVNSGESVALGGIYENTRNRNIAGIPFLSKLPIIGILFQNQKIINKKRELLIFITAKIISS